MEKFGGAGVGEGVKARTSVREARTVLHASVRPFWLLGHRTEERRKGEENT